MDSIQPRSRRIFLADLGKAVVGLAVLTTACSGDVGEASTTGPTSTTKAALGTTSAATTEAPDTTAPSTEVPDTTEPPAGAAAVWERVALGNVSAYVVARHGEATIVDTGNPGSEPLIGDTLRALGLDWADVGHVILTHRHGDHVGSVDAVMSLAAEAAAYAGAEDIPNINTPRSVVAVGDNDSIGGLKVIATPGHTLGHISILDPELNLLIAGDSMIGQDGGVAGPSPRFTSDMVAANASVVKMSEFQFDTVVFGHGDPVIGGASDRIKELASGL